MISRLFRACRHARPASSLTLLLIVVLVGIASYNIPAAYASTDSVSVLIQQSPSKQSLSSTFNGFSYEKSTLTSRAISEDNGPLVSLYEQLGPGILQAGGNSADSLVWDPSGPGLNSSKLSPPDIERLAGFLRKTNWKIIYLLNFSIGTPPVTSEPSQAAVAAAAANAAKEAAYVSSALGSSLLGFEIGNEPGAYNHNGLRPSGFDFSDYESEWKTFVDAIRAEVPSAVFIGPGDVTFTPDFMTSLGSEVKLVTEHYYDGTGQVSDALQLALTSNSYLNDSVLPMLSTMSSKVPVPYRMDEANAFSVPMTPGNWFALALWGIDFEFVNALNHSTGVNFSSVYGLSPIDIDEGSGSIERVNPLFYGMKLFSMAANGDLLKTSVSAQQSSLSAYAVAGNNGSTYVVLNNKNSNTAMETTITFMQPVDSASVTVLTAPSLTSGSGTTLGGASIGTDGEWSSPKTDSVAVSNGAATFTVPAHSAAFVEAKPATTLIGIPADGLCVESTQNTSSGPYFQQQRCNSSSSAQDFAFVPTSDGYYNIRPQNSNLCLDWQNPEKAVLQTACVQSATQEWALHKNSNSYYFIESTNGEYCLSVDSGYSTPGASIHTWKCNGGEYFSLTSAPKPSLKTSSSTVVVSNDGDCMDVREGTYSTGNYIQQHPCTGESNESFAFSSTVDGYYTINSNLNQLCLQASSGGSDVAQDVCTGETSQKWQLEHNSDGTYSIMGQNSHNCLGIANDSTAFGSLFAASSCNASAGQKFKLASPPEVLQPE